MDRNFLKNIIIATVATSIYYANIVEGMPRIKVFVGVCSVFWSIVALLEIFDAIGGISCKTKKGLSKHRFCNYKNKLAGVVEKQRVKGRDEAWMKDFVINYIMHDKRFAFSGKQIAELLSLAADAERSA